MKISKIILPLSLLGMLMLGGCMAMMPMMHGDEDSGHEMSMGMMQMGDDEEEVDAESSHGEHSHGVQNTRPRFNHKDSDEK